MQNATYVSTKAHNIWIIPTAIWLWDRKGIQKQVGFLWDTVSALPNVFTSPHFSPGTIILQTVEEVLEEERRPRYHRKQWLQELWKQLFKSLEARKYQVNYWSASVLSPLPVHLVIFLHSQAVIWHGLAPPGSVKCTLSREQEVQHQRTWACTPVLILQNNALFLTSSPKETPAFIPEQYTVNSFS